MGDDLKSNEEWRAWGEIDPMFGVASWQGRKQGEDNAWTAEEFYRLARSDWDDFRHIWLALYPPKPGTVLEIGAGAGRMSNQLADHFAQVKAVDVSPGMLDFARKHVTKPNIEWILGDGLRLPANDASVQAVFSVHVFQHFNDVEAVRHNLLECVRILEPGGSLFIHTYVHAFPEAGQSFSRLARKAYRLFMQASARKAERRRRAMRSGGAEPYMHGLSHEASDLLALAAEVGLAERLVVTMPPSISGGMHSVLVARKP
ncbi:MAG: class I SAM-dependent methyltransferase [Sphingomonadales bacterium]|nr:class I SAM-dependent methyltransferase [Sphingomonadales bacterium]